MLGLQRLGLSCLYLLVLGSQQTLQQPGDDAGQGPEDPAYGRERVPVHGIGLHQVYGRLGNDSVGRGVNVGRGVRVARGVNVGRGVKILSMSEGVLVGCRVG